MSPSVQNPLAPPASHYAASVVDAPSEAAVPIREAAGEAPVFDCSTCGAQERPLDRLPCKVCEAPDYLAWRPMGEPLATVEGRGGRLGPIAVLPMGGLGLVVHRVASVVTGLAAWIWRGGAADLWRGREPGRIGERP